MEIRREMQPVIRRNKNKANVNDAYKAFGPQRNSNNSVKLQVGYWVGSRDLAVLARWYCGLSSVIVLMYCTQVCNPAVQC